MTTLKSQAEARADAQKQEDLKKRAARQAAKQLRDPQEIPQVEVTILPLGDGKISMGEHVGGIGEAYFEEGEKVTLQLPIAVGLYDRGFVNFEGAKEASKEVAARRANAEKAAMASLTDEEREAMLPGSQ